MKMKYKAIIKGVKVETALASKLVSEVKAQRAEMDICPSAKPGVNVSNLIQKYCDENFYKADFDIITETLINETIDYKNIINTMHEIAGFDFW